MKYRLGWLPYERYSGVTVAADYRGSVTVKTTAVSDYCTKQTVVTDSRGRVPEQIPCFFIALPSKPWRTITAEAYRVNHVFFFITVPSKPWRTITAEA